MNGAEPEIKREEKQRVRKQERARNRKREKQRVRTSERARNINIEI